MKTKVNEIQRHRSTGIERETERERGAKNTAGGSDGEERGKTEEEEGEEWKAVIGNGHKYSKWVFKFQNWGTLIFSKIVSRLDLWIMLFLFFYLL